MMSGIPRLTWRAGLPFGPQGWLWRTPGFTAVEVQHLLTVTAPHERAQAVRRCVARASDWLPEPHIVRCPPHIHRQLTRIVFWYAQGVSLGVIAARLNARETGWETTRALHEACRCIAVCLNSAPHLYGLDLGQRWFAGMRAR